MNQKDYKEIDESEWDFASCDNFYCPQHPKNGGEPNKHYPKFNNNKNTLCNVCVEVKE